MTRTKIRTDILVVGAGSGVLSVAVGAVQMGAKDLAGRGARWEGIV